MGMGLPKIPDAEEISAMTTKAMEPMMADLAAIRGHLEELVELQRAQVNQPA